MADMNGRVAELLSTIADLMEIKGESIYRVVALRDAARTVETLTEPIAGVLQAGRLEELPAIGPGIAARIREFLETGHSRELDRLAAEFPPSLAELLRVPGLGPAKVRHLYQTMKISNLADLRRAADEGALATVPGFGKKTQDRIIRELGRLQERSKRMLLGVALPAAELIVSQLRDHPAIEAIEPAGSLRRRRETIGDIDIIAASRRPEEAMRALCSLPVVREVIASGPAFTTVLTNQNLQIDLKVVPPESFGAALLHFTGSQAHNIRLRERAIARGLRLNEYGLTDERTGERVAADEPAIYTRLGLQYIPPELREDRGEIDAAAAGTLPELARLEDILGDLHIHSDWSDGTAPLDAMVESAIRSGFRYVALTDHSRSLGVANGLSIERVRQQWQLVEELNRRYAPFRILRGTEVDILADGRLDYPDELLLEFEIVTASVHSSFQQPVEQMTGRILTALQTGLVDIFNHPTGRLLQLRNGYEVDLAAVIDEAARQGTAMEINASPDRLDLDDVWTRRARQKSVPIAISTDSHGTGGFSVMKYGVFVARRAWVTADGLLNTRSADEVIAFVQERRRRAGRAA